MNKEIKVILEEFNPYKQGNCFETMIRNILETQRYKVKSDINFTGMEIDLIAEHKDRSETVYVECKAKEKVSADEISKFAFNVSHKKADFGLFIRTKELTHQAAGLISEMKTEGEDRYSNLTFFEPEKVIELLQESDFIKKNKNPNNNVRIVKEILAVTYFGDFYIEIINDSLASVPNRAVIINAINNNPIEDNYLKILEDNIPEIQNLTVEKKPITDWERSIEPEIGTVLDSEVESISEVQESEHWYDYLPASTTHFVGRDKLRTDILHFFDDVSNGTTKRRLFYLTGKSGWGKSSLIAEIRGRTRNKYYKNKYYTTAIDSRSALSSNFVALSFERLIRNAIHDKFISRDIFTCDVSFDSSFDVLSSNQVQSLFEKLATESKILILIFDQFEDVFRKNGLFKAFYKFLSDVTDSGLNLIVGFSWKTEILIPSENEAYHYWQQSKEQAVHFQTPKFGPKETNLVIKQLEKSIGKIDISLKRRIVESSQGFPWLVKKLCIHIFDQVKSGKKKLEILDENLNFESLFNKDLDDLSPEELKYLKYIAQRAYSGNFFEASEVNDTVPESIINTLRDDKRLVIRSGINYNIYWDVFRDFLVTGEVPEIGESYVIRSSPNSCQEIFLLYSNNQKLSSKKIQDSLAKVVTIQTIENCIIDLRGLGILRKSDREDSFELTSDITNVDENSFKTFITDKLKSNTVYIRAKEFSDEITTDAMVNILKDIFKGFTYKDRTWRTYANYFINWFYYSSLDIRDKLGLIGKGHGKSLSFYKNIEQNRKISMPRNYPKKIIDNIRANEFTKLHDLDSSFLRDLALLNLIVYKRDKLEVTKELLNIKSDPKLVNVVVAKNALLIDKISRVSEILKTTPKEITAKKILADYPEIFDKPLRESSKLIYAAGLIRWAKFCNKLNK